jgi:hypothetical protein
MGLLRTYRTQQSDLESIMEGLGITAYRTWAEGKFIPLLALLGRRGGTAQVNPPNPAVVFSEEEYGGYMKANYAARDCASRFNAPWRHRYPVGRESPLWVVRIPGAYAVVPNSLYCPNMPWKDLLEVYPNSEGSK